MNTLLYSSDGARPVTGIGSCGVTVMISKQWTVSSWTQHSRCNQNAKTRKNAGIIDTSLDETYKQLKVTTVYAGEFVGEKLLDSRRVDR